VFLLDYICLCLSGCVFFILMCRLSLWTVVVWNKWMNEWMNNNKPPNIDDRPHRIGDFCCENLLSLNCFCGLPVSVGTLADSMPGNTDVRAIGNAARRHAGKYRRHPPSKLSLPVADLDPIQYNNSFALPESTSHSALDRFSCFCRTHGCYRQTDRQTTLLGL